MCLFGSKWPKHAESQTPSPAGSVARSLTINPIPGKAPEESSLDISTNYTISQSLSKESKYSRASYSSSGSGISLASLKGLLSDGAQFFTYRDIIKATDNFSPGRQLGDRSFRGTMSGKDVTVIVEKRICMDVDFVAEVKGICNLHHSNLIRLIGGCISGDLLYLVYDHISGGNLRQCLKSTNAPGFTTLNSWTIRLRIALDVAKGLEYLHEHASPPFVHKYIKSTRIILDNDLHPRISSVGVSRVRGEAVVEPGASLNSASKGETTRCDEKSMPRSQQPEILPGRHLRRSLRRSRSIKIWGTHGYMAPEYTLSGEITPKVDIYAFGVVLLELLSGEEAVKLQHNPGELIVKKTMLADVIASIFLDPEPRAKVRAWIDPQLGDLFPLDCAFRAAFVARKCVDANPDERPPMRKVALSLEQIYTASREWEENMLASKRLMTSALTGR